MAKADKLKRSTVYLEPKLHQALKVQAAETSRNVSELINEAIRESLRQDRDDLQAFDDRADEATISFEKLIKRLDLDGEL